MAQSPGIKACVFDAYGTLFDVHSALAKHRARVGERADALSALWRTKQLEYTWQRSLMGRYADFWHVTQDALDYALDAFGIADDALRYDLLDAYLSLDAYPDVADALAKLKQHGVRLAILSNGSPKMLQAVVGNTGLGHLFDDVLSVDEVQAYKPDPRVYRLAVERLAAEPPEISFQSANAWDAAGAANVGLSVIWINRTGQQVERLPARPHLEISTLSDLPAVLGYP